METRNTRIVSIASGKGGVGKTTVALNLAWALANGGRSVCLFDADLGLANMDTMLGLRPEKTLEQVLFEDAPIEDAVMRVADGVDVISGSAGVSRMAELSLERCESLVTEFSKLEQYDFLFVDNAPGISAQVISLCLTSHDTIIVITPEATSLTASYALIRVLRENGLWWRPMILVNKARNPRQAGAVYYHLRNATHKLLRLDCAYVGYVLEDEAVREAVDRQRPLLEVFPGSQASHCFSRISGRLIEPLVHKGVSVSPARFWEQSVKMAKQEPRLLGLPHRLLKDGKEEPSQPKDEEGRILYSGEIEGLEKILNGEAREQDWLNELFSKEPIPAEVVERKTAPLEAPPEGEQPLVEEAGAAARGKILIICPHEDMMGVIVDIVEGLGYEAVQWQGEDKPPESESYRLVVLSWDRETAPLYGVLETWKDNSILLLAGYLQQADEGLRRRPGIRQVVEKPFRLETLRDAIQRLAQ